MGSGKSGSAKGKSPSHNSKFTRAGYLKKEFKKGAPKVGKSNIRKTAK